MNYPELPSEFFQPAELLKMAGTLQRTRVIGWLKQCGTPHVIGLHRWPLVYRNRLLPDPANEAHNDHPKFDFTAGRATRRKTSQGR